MIPPPLRAALFVLAASVLPARAASPDLSTQAAEFEVSLSKLSAPVQRLGALLYTTPDHDQLAGLLAELGPKALTLEAAVPGSGAGLSSSVQRAAQAEAGLWATLSPPRKAGTAPIEKASAQALLVGLAAVVKEFSAFLTRLAPPQLAAQKQALGAQPGVVQVTAVLSAQGKALAKAGGSKDPREVAAELDRLFQEGRGRDEIAVAGGGSASGAGSKPGELPLQPAQPKGFVAKDVAAPVLPGAAADGPTLGELKLREAALAAMDLWPLRDAAAPVLAATRREIKLVEWEKASNEYLAAHGLPPLEGGRSGLAAAQRKFEVQLDASATGKEESALRRKLGDLQKQADALNLDLSLAVEKQPYFARLQDLSARLDSLSEAESAELAGLKAKLEALPAYQRYQARSEALGAEMLEAARAMQAVQACDPAYFLARGAWGEYVRYNRDALGGFAEGTRFTPAELGIDDGKVPSGVVKKSAHLGQAGFQFTNREGLTHFETPDGTLTLDEMRVAGKAFFIENTFRGGKMAVTTYDEKKKKVGVQFYEPVKDGRFVSYTEAAPWPRTTGRFRDGVFEAERVDNEDGTAQVRVGQDAPGAWLSKDKTGAATGWSLDGSALSDIKDTGERLRSIEKSVRWLVKDAAPGTTGARAKYRGDSITALLQDQFRYKREGTIQVLLDRDLKIVINNFRHGGVDQTVGMFEPTGTGWSTEDGSNQGLTIYVRSASAPNDQTAQFTKIFQYLGNWGMERYSSKVETNADRWYWWAVGPSTWEIPVVERFDRADGKLGRSHGKVEKEEITVYSGPGILGATGQAVATVGKGVVDLAGAGVAVGLANSPGYLALISATGGDVGYAREDLLARAKVDFFNNAISSELGDIYGGEGYKQGKAALKLDESRYIQNVGREMSDMGHPALGAVLQGGVNFANNTVPLLLNLKGLQVVSKMGNAGKLASAGFGVYMSAEGGWHFGGAVQKFGTAMADYDERDPASKAAYYASLQNLTEQSLNLPMLLGGLKDVYAKGKGAGAHEVGLLTKAANAKVPVPDMTLTMPSWAKLPGWASTAGGKVAAGDAMLPGWLAKVPGGKWLNGELGMKPVVPEGPKEVVHLDSNLLMLVERGNPAAIEYVNNLRAQGKDLRITPQVVLEMYNGKVGAAELAKVKAFMAEVTGKGKVTVDGLPAELTPQQQADQASLVKLLMDNGVGVKPGKGGATGGDAEILATIMVRAKGERGRLYTDEGKLTRHVENTLNKPAFQAALKKAGLEGYLVPEVVRWNQPAGVVTPPRPPSVARMPVRVRTDAETLAGNKLSAEHYRRILDDPVYRAEQLRETMKTTPTANEQLLLDSAKRLLAETPVLPAQNEISPIVAKDFNGAPETYRAELAASKAPLVEVKGVLSTEGSSAVLLDATLAGQSVAVKTYKKPTETAVESMGEKGAWDGTLKYFREEIALARELADTLPGMAPKVFGEVDLGGKGNPSWAMEKVKGKTPEELTPAEAREYLTPEAMRQAAEGIKRLGQKGLGGGDSPQAMILTEPQLVNGVPKKAGDVVFIDPGGLTRNKSIWKTPQDMAADLAYFRARADNPNAGNPILLKKAQRLAAESLAGGKAKAGTDAGFEPASPNAVTAKGEPKAKGSDILERELPDVPALPVSAGRPQGYLFMDAGGKTVTLKVMLDRKPGTMEATFLGMEGGGKGVAVKTAEYVGLQGKAPREALKSLAQELAILREASKAVKAGGFPENFSVAEPVGLGVMDAALSRQIFGHGEQVPVMLMKKSSGRTLQSLLDSGKPLRGSDFEGFLKGVRKLNELGIAHGDLNMGNILVAENASGGQSFTLIDFGAARRVSKMPANRQAAARTQDVAEVQEILGFFQEAGALK